MLCLVTSTSIRNIIIEPLGLGSVGIDLGLDVLRLGNRVFVVNRSSPVLII